MISARMVWGWGLSTLLSSSDDVPSGAPELFVLRCTPSLNTHTPSEVLEASQQALDATKLMHCAKGIFKEPMFGEWMRRSTFQCKKGVFSEKGGGIQ